MSTDRIDGVLRRYLLGTLDPAVREEVEKRLFSQDQIFWEQMCLAEDELVDAYAADQLDADDRHRFDECFLVTDERRDKLMFTRELKAYAANAHGETRPEPRKQIAVPPWAIAAAAVLVAVLPAVAWQMARLGQSGATASAWLSAGTVRSVDSELERVRVPLDAALVRLHLEVEPAKHPAYRATLLLAGGDELWSQNNLRPMQIDDRQAIEVTLPAQMLPADDYFIRLFGLSPPNEPVAIGRYDFRVLRSP
jgi:hypothetical protein